MKKELLNELVKSLQEYIRIPSKFTTPEKGAPRGKYVKQSLEYALSLGKKLGFTDGEVIDGVVCWLEVGESEQDFAILCHADVVPEGNGWSVDAYGGEIIDGKVYGRGAIDDKGPTLCAMYAIYDLLKEGKKPTKKIRFIIGGDEEGYPKVNSPYAINDMDSIEIYKKYRPMPDIGFSPDADFPVIYAEKGILHLELSCKADEHIKEFFGGERANIVPNYASCVCGGKKIESAGISAHGSTPENGKNAIVGLLSKLAKNYDFESRLYEYFKYTDGKGLNIDCKDEQSGALTMNIGVVRQENDILHFTVDIRYPVTKDKDEIINKIKSIWIGDVSVVMQKDPLYVPKDDILVKTLLESYQAITGDNSEPIAIGGGTYARDLKKGVGFGAYFPGEEEKAHMVDEYVKIENLEKVFEIYKLAIEKLCF